MTMYLWNSKSLALGLREGLLSERETFKYFLGATLLALLQFQLLLMLGSGGFSPQGLIFGAVNLFIAVIGSVVVYKTNSEGDSKNFIERFVCISFPVNIKIFLLRAVGYFIYLVLLGATMNVPDFWVSESAVTRGHTVFGYLTLLLFYLLMNKNMAIASTSKNRI
jgi:hypothetical protein